MYLINIWAIDCDHNTLDACRGSEGNDSGRFLHLIEQLHRDKGQTRSNCFSLKGFMVVQRKAYKFICIS